VFLHLDEEHLNNYCQHESSKCCLKCKFLGLEREFYQTKEQKLSIFLKKLRITYNIDSG